MGIDPNKSDAADSFILNTAQFAARNLVKENTVRSAHHLNGHYFGVVPKKLANGRLAWPDVQVAK